MDKNEYLTGVGNAFDQGRMDAQSGTAKQSYGGAYAVGYDGYYLQGDFRSISIDAASKGWDDGASGAARGAPDLPSIMSAGNVVADLQETYNFAYDLGKTEKEPKKSYAGWIAAAGAILAGAVAAVYVLKNDDANENPSEAFQKARTKSLLQRWKAGEVKVVKWSERDRAMVGVQEVATGQHLIEWWDDDVYGLIEDGFISEFGSRDFERSVIDYAIHVGARAYSKVR